MPSYDYQCQQCRNKFEATHRISDPKPRCPSCGGKCAKLILQAPAAHGAMAVGREQAIRSLQTQHKNNSHSHGPGCACCHR